MLNYGDCTSAGGFLAPGASRRRGRLHVLEAVRGKSGGTEGYFFGCGGVCERGAIESHRQRAGHVCSTDNS